MSDRPDVLAVTTHRPHEVAEPLTLTDATTDVLKLDGDAGFVTRNVRAVREIHGALRRQGADVLLLDCRELLGLFVALVAAVHRVPIVFRFKGDYWTGLEEWYRPEKGDGVWKLVQYYLSVVTNEVVYALATGFIVVSEPLRDVVVERTGCRSGQVQVVNVPFASGRTDGDPDRARERFGVGEDSVVLTVSNLAYRGKRDGVVTSIEGMRRVLADRDDVSYVVAGDGAYHEDLVALVEETTADESVRDRIHLPGYVDEVGDLHALADVFVYISHLDGYPNAVLEAQQAGLAAVVNDAHGMTEQVDHGQTGLQLVDPGPGDVAAAVERLLDSPEERARLGANARDRVSRENDPAVIGRELVDALETILQTDATGGRTRLDSPVTAE